MQKKPHQREFFVVVCCKKQKNECNKQPLVWGKVALHIKHKKSNLSLMRYWFLVVCSVKQQKMNATSNIWCGLRLL